jgi:hypothetical protein
MEARACCVPVRGELRDGVPWHRALDHHQLDHRMQRCNENDSTEDGDSAAPWFRQRQHPSGIAKTPPAYTSGGALLGITRICRVLLLSSAKCSLRRGTNEYRSRSRFKIRDAELCRSRNAPKNTVAEVLSLPPLPLFGSTSDCATTADRNPGVAPVEANAVFKNISEPPLANFRPWNRQLLAPLALSAMVAVSCFGCGARVRVGEVTHRLRSHETVAAQLSGKSGSTWVLKYLRRLRVRCRFSTAGLQFSKFRKTISHLEKVVGMAFEA